MLRVIHGASQRRPGSLARLPQNLICTRGITTGDHPYKSEPSVPNHLLSVTERRQSKSTTTCLNLLFIEQVNSQHEILRSHPKEKEGQHCEGVSRYRRRNNDTECRQHKFVIQRHAELSSRTRQSEILTCKLSLGDNGGSS